MPAEKNTVGEGLGIRLDAPLVFEQCTDMQHTALLLLLSSSDWRSYDYMELPFQQSIVNRCVGSDMIGCVYC